MAKIVGIGPMTPEQVHAEILRGGKFVVFPYVISVFVMTFTRSSDVFFIRAGEKPVVKGVPYILLTLVAGWWGFPWGLIRTPIALVQGLSGGKDVTRQVMSLMQRVPAATTAAAPTFDLGLPENPW